MISITMSLAEFNCVKKFASGEDAQLKAHDFKLSNMSEDGLSGHVHTKEIDADFEYRTVGSALVLDNEVKHGLYGFASDKTIGGHLMAVLGGLTCDEDTSTTVVQEQNSTSTQVPVTENVKQNNLSQFVKRTTTT